MSDPRPPLPERIRRVPHVAQRRVGDEVIVLDLRGSRVYGFNPAAGILLEQLRCARPTGELLGLAQSAGADGARLRDFLSGLLARGLLTGECDAPGEESEAPAPLAWSGEPALLWSEEAARVTNQISPPQAITNPQCQP